MKGPGLRSIPSVDKVLQALGNTDLPRAIVLGVVRRQLDALRRGKQPVPDFDRVVADVQSRLRAARESQIQPVINGTGVVIHTNFGRAPLGPAVVERVAAIASNYNNLEYGL